MDGGFTISRDPTGKIRSVTGTGALPGTGGGNASVTVKVSRLGILPLYGGYVSVADSGAHLRLRTPVLLTRLSEPDSATVSGKSYGLDLSRFPWRPYTLTWTVSDQG